MNHLSPSFEEKLLMLKLHRWKELEFAEVNEKMASLILEISKSKPIQELYDSISKLEEDYDKIRYSLIRALSELIIRTISGEPLKGFCDLCPRIKIEGYD